MLTKQKSKPRQPNKQTRSRRLAKPQRSRRPLLRAAVAVTGAGDQDESVAALKTEVDTTGTELAQLIAETRQRRSKHFSRMTTPAQTNSSLSLDYSDQLIQLGKKQLREFDSSEEITNLITRFQKLNDTIEQTIQQVEKIKKFIDTATKIAQVLDTLIQAAMKAAA